MRAHSLENSFARLVTTHHVCQVVDDTIGLRDLICHPRYTEQVANIVRLLLKNKESELRYAALEIISAGLGEVEIATTLLMEAKPLLKEEKCQYIIDYLRSIS